MDIKYAASIKPTKRQIALQKMEFYGFIHFGINTMYNNEWGSGLEDPSKFNPQNIDTDDWIRSLKSAGMKGAILTCKHHDGFCLWPSKFSNHTVASSPWKNGSGDLVADFADSCRKYDLNFGIYLSPWDMYEHTYGSGDAYNDFYINQLTELLTQYGEVFAVWLDGANGEGPNGKIQKYDWDRYYHIIRSLQPNAVISVSGPDIRWVGNEAGKTRENEWSVVPESMKDPVITAGLSQKEDSSTFRETFTTGDEDLGSRSRLRNYSGKLIWYPAEVDLSIRPGWFYHEDEDNQVMTPDELFNVYLNSVGKNSTLLLNVPPNKDGVIHQKDKVVLEELGKKINHLYSKNLIKSGVLKTSSNLYSVTTKDLINSSVESSFLQFSNEDVSPCLEILWDKPVLADTILLGEYIPHGQLIDSCRIEIKTDNGQNIIKEVECIGYRRIVTISTQKIKSLKVQIKKFRDAPNLNFLSVTCINKF